MRDGEGCKKAAFAPPPILTEGGCVYRTGEDEGEEQGEGDDEQGGRGRNDGECDVGMYEYEHVRMQERGLDRMHFRRSERGVGGSSSW